MDGLRRWLYRALRLGELAHFFAWIFGFGLLGVLGSILAGLSQLPFYSKVGIVISALAALVGGLGILAPHFRPVVNVAVGPTGGPSPDLRLAVTNHGRGDEFSARATVIRTRNDPNPIRTGQFQLKWLNSDIPGLPLLTGHQADLLIATLTQLPLDKAGEHWYRMEIQQLEGRNARTWESFTWLAAPGEKFPECDLEISIRASHAARAFQALFTVRPAGPWRPLEMVRSP